MATVRVFFATNRNYQPRGKTPGFGSTFNPDGVAALRFGYADFDVDGATPTMTGLSVYPDKPKEQDLRKTGGGQFLEALRLRMQTERSDTLVFIHGFNVTFEGALMAGALMARDIKVMDQPLNVVVFSWPSDGRAVPFMSYYSDREDARASGPALARAFLKLREFLIQLPDDDYCLRCLHLLAHSMGAYVVRNGLQALIAKDADALTRLFDQVLLAAPDEDEDAFELDSKLRLLPRIGRQVTVYFNPNDKGLLVSDRTKANPDRLGSDGPRMVDQIPKKVVLVDCRNVAGHADRFIEHSYYIRSIAMSQDIGAVLSGAALDDIGNRTFIERARVWRVNGELGTRPIPAAAHASALRKQG